MAWIHLSNCMPLTDLGDRFHAPCGLMKTVTPVNSRHTIGQIDNQLMQYGLYLYLHIKQMPMKIVLKSLKLH